MIDVAKLKKQVKKLNSKSITNELSKKVTSKDIIKNQKVIKIKVGNEKAPSILGDENRFFTGSFEKEKRSLFMQ